MSSTWRVAICIFLGTYVLLLAAWILRPALFLLAKTNQPALANLKRVADHLRMACSWRFHEIHIFLEKYLSLEQLPTIAAGMKKLGMVSLLDWHWRGDVIREQKSAWTNSHQKPMFFLPGLTSKAFYDCGEFPELAFLEDEYPNIKKEYLALTMETASFSPYINETGLAFHPLVADQSGATHKYQRNDWQMYHFFLGGELVPASRSSCPHTHQVLAKIPGLEKTMCCFSKLGPTKWIPPHFGFTNAILRVHLPLIVEGDCRIRVGQDTRPWQEGKLMIFDDSYEHEVWNHSDKARVVLFINIFHPSLSTFEQESLRAFITHGIFEIPAAKKWRQDNLGR